MTLNGYFAMRFAETIGPIAKAILLIILFVGIGAFVDFVIEVRRQEGGQKEEESGKTNRKEEEGCSRQWLRLR